MGVTIMVAFMKQMMVRDLAILFQPMSTEFGSIKLVTRLIRATMVITLSKFFLPSYFRYLLYKFRHSRATTIVTITASKLRAFKVR